MTREDNPLTVHFSSLGIATVPSSPIRPREAGPSEAPQLVLACQTTLNIEVICEFIVYFQFITVGFTYTQTYSPIHVLLQDFKTSRQLKLRSLYYSF